MDTWARVGAWDDHLDCWDEFEDRREEILAAIAREGIWLTRDGQQIPITQMHTQHLLNVLNMLVKGGEDHPYRIYIDRIREELDQR